jgi:glycerol-3-phosphate acyltransferase PlsY
VLVLDIAKGALPILLGRRLGAGDAELAAAAVAVVAGHMYPLFHGFRGGKGVATAAGALGALQWQLLVPSGLVFVLTAAVSRYVSLASILAAALYALLAWWWGPERSAGAWTAAAASLIALLVVWRHRDNIARLLARSETRLGERSRG